MITQPCRVQVEAAANARIDSEGARPIGDFERASIVCAEPTGANVERRAPGGPGGLDLADGPARF